MKRIASMAPHVALVALFAALGLGEGLGQAFLGVTLGAVAFALVFRADRAEIVKAAFGSRTLRVLFAFMLWAVATMFLNRYGVPRSRDSTKLYNFLPLLAVPLAVSLSPARAKRDAALALFASLAFASVLGILQYRFGVMWLAKLSGTPEARWQLPLDEAGTRFMASGFFYNRLKFSGALLAALSLAVFLVPTLPKKALSLGASLLMLVGLLLSFSRAATLALIAGCALLSRRAWLVLLGALTLGALLIFFVPQVGERLGTVVQKSAYADRLFLWARAREIIADHPLIGVGYGNYGNVCGPYYDRVDPTFVMRAQSHNEFLTTLAETGPLGLTLFLALLVTLAVDLRRRNDAFARGALASLISFVILCFTHDPLFSPAVALAFTAVWGLGQSTATSACVGVKTMRLFQRN